MHLKTVKNAHNNIVWLHEMSCFVRPTTDILNLLSCKKKAGNQFFSILLENCLNDYSVNKFFVS